jgi:hypothetical protein
VVSISGEGVEVESVDGTSQHFHRSYVEQIAKSGASALTAQYRLLKKDVVELTACLSYIFSLG